MGTSNFYNKNATSIFALEIRDQWEWDMQYEDLLIQLCDAYGYTVYNQSDAPTPDSNNRSFGGLVLGEKSKHYIGNDVELIVTIRAIIRSGYYSDANLDWEIETEKIHREPLSGQQEVWIESAREDLTDELESFYSEVSTELGVTARFSNGNCMYHKKEN